MGNPAPPTKYIPPHRIIPHSVPSSPPITLASFLTLPPVSTLIPNTMMPPPMSAFQPCLIPITSTATGISTGTFVFQESGDLDSILGQSAEDDALFRPDLMPPVSKEEFSKYLPDLSNLPDTSMSSPVFSGTCLPTNPVTSPVNSPIHIIVEQAVFKLARENHISQQQYQFLMENSRDPRLVQVVSSAHQQLYFNILVLLAQTSILQPPL